MTHQSPKLLDQVRATMRREHYSPLRSFARFITNPPLKLDKSPISEYILYSSFNKF